MGLQESIRESFVQYLNEYYVSDQNPVTEVTSWQEEERNDGFCETCWYDYTVVVCEAILRDGTTKTITISSSFADLIGILTKY